MCEVIKLVYPEYFSACKLNKFEQRGFIRTLSMGVLLFWFNTDLWRILNLD